MQINPLFNVHYSEDEHVIGTWIDGKTLYEKTVDFGALPNTATKSVAHGIANIDKIIDIESIAISNGVSVSLSYTDTGGLQYSMGILSNATDITIKTGSNRSGYSAYVTLRYTKTV